MKLIILYTSFIDTDTATQCAIGLDMVTHSITGCKNRFKQSEASLVERARGASTEQIVWISECKKNSIWITEILLVIYLLIYSHQMLKRLTQSREV